MPTLETPDAIDRLAAIAPGSALDALRRQRPDARVNAQASYEALFQPPPEATFTRSERLALAAFVALLHADGGVVEHYEGLLLAQPGTAGLVPAVRREAGRGKAVGPYGHYPPGPLSAEDAAGPTYRVADLDRVVLGERLTAAFEHAHLLVFHPRDARPEALKELLQAGWSTAEIVTLSQLVAFLSFQIRVVKGLRVLAG